MKTAVIVGCEGQDGKLLYELLLEKHYRIVGISRTCIRPPGVYEAESIDIRCASEVFDLIRIVRPDEVYYLAAFHHSSDDHPLDLDNVDLFRRSDEIHVLSLVNFLEAIRRYSKDTRLFYAASSRVFGDAVGEFQNESTPLNPRCIYGITKAAGLLICRAYRNDYSLFISAGILYNHESIFRHPKFVSKKIIRGAINIKNKEQDKLVLNDLHAAVDWGYAPDYVEAMYRILNISSPEDFVIATGEKHTVFDFVKVVFEYLKLDWNLYVEQNPDSVVNTQSVLIGDARKLKRLTGWKPTVGFRQMIRTLLVEEGVVFDEGH